MKKIKTVAHDIKEWDKRLARRIQDRFNLTDYQMLCLAFAKGFIIGAIILWSLHSPSSSFLLFL